MGMNAADYEFTRKIAQGHRLELAQIDFAITMRTADIKTLSERRILIAEELEQMVIKLRGADAN